MLRESASLQKFSKRRRRATDSAERIFGGAILALGLILVLAAGLGLLSARANPATLFVRPDGAGMYQLLAYSHVSWPLTHVSADHTLFWANANNGVVGTHPVFGDPRLLPDGYHLGPGSAAIDAGANAGMPTDIDGDKRPLGMGYDIGADEARFIYIPLVLRTAP